MFALTFDQRLGREAGDLVPDLMTRLRFHATLVPFQRSVADEVQGIVDDPAVAVDAALIGLRGGNWSVGIGVGRVDDLVSDHVLDAAGPAMVHTRNAAERSLTITDRVALSVEGLDEELAAEAEAVLRLVGRIVAVRTEAEWRVADLMTPGARGQQKAIAAELGITVQAVSQAVQRSLLPQEWAARPAAARLLGLLDRQRVLSA
ncbi:hypothetical protein V6N00_07910 [Tersicoccus sp. MR15.9]|uniref:hypothetical protein n=1 Tax=Tersicoccus mangrovi TaxID=3121635 RepID=UPI002FE5DE8B